MKKITALILAIVLALPCLSSCGDKLISFWDYSLFDTETMIIGYDTSREQLRPQAKNIIDFLYEYHKLFDIYNDYDGVTNIKSVNEANGEPVKVDGRIIELLEFGKSMYNFTGGKMNIAMGSVTRIWHDYREEGTEIPTAEELENAALHTSIDDIVIDREKGTVTLADPEMSIDVGAIAKGYAEEEAVKYFTAQGYDNIAISIGGNVRVIGTKNDGTPWETSIKNPIEGSSNTMYATVDLVDNAAVTSGSYQRYYEVNGVRYHHIIDPETLMPENRYLSVSVVYSNSGIADALSTALFNMSEEEGRKIVEPLGVEVLWIYPDGTCSQTGGFEIQ